MFFKYPQIIWCILKYFISYIFYILSMYISASSNIFSLRYRAKLEEWTKGPENPVVEDDFCNGWTFQKVQKIP